MRVLQVMAGAPFGGAETHFVDLVTALHRAGLDQRVVIRAHQGRAAALREAGIVPAELRFGGPIDWVSGRRLARAIAEYRPDIVQSWMRRATRFVSRPRRAPKFVHVGWFGGYYPLADYRRCDHLVGVTPAIRDHQISAGWPADRAHYMPTFADGEHATPVSRAELGTPDGSPLFLALGRLHAKKAFDILIRAVAQLPDAHLWIAGEGPLRDALTRLITDLGLGDRVRLLGWREDRAALFAAADYCVLPSRYEPFGTVMIEAWAHDRPLIAAAADGPRGLIEDGLNGLLVPIDDIDALTAAMARLIQDRALAGRLVDAGQAAYSARFTEAAVVARYLEFYRGILTS
ncbi:MAG: glycosyltransferase [Alphaproteobacteria bacterium]|nr:glycosyltransferase [Alphaproteobacteria bacterium]